MKHQSYDAVVVGSGPNGFAAAITLARAGRSVVILEAKETLGGGMRSAELTLPGFIHDICSAIHPLGLGSPFFSSLPLDRHGLEWIHPTIPLAHPFDDGTAALLKRSIVETSLTLGSDANAYQNLMAPLVDSWDILKDDLLAPFGFPKHPWAMLKFGLLGFKSASNLAKSRFSEARARALFAGLAGHSILPLDKPLTSAFGLILGILGHAVGWPIARGGSQKIADALASYFKELGGECITGYPVASMRDLPKAKSIFFDVSPHQLLQITGDLLPSGYAKKLKSYRYGPGVYKVDWALSQPIPWKAAGCKDAGTIHLGASFEEIRISEKQVWDGTTAEFPFVLLAQPSLFDSSRAPAGKHTAWGYCHVPNNSTVDMTGKIEAQIERFAPGFKDCILARSCKSARDLEAYNANYIGGDINGGVQDLYQLFTRPVARYVPYTTPVEGLYICSSSTPPGGGVHGMCGYHAALANIAGH